MRRQMLPSACSQRNAGLPGVCHVAGCRNRRRFRRGPSCPVCRAIVLTALPHYLPLAIFPLILAAAVNGGWWLLPPLLFMSASGPLDRILGLDGRNLDPTRLSAHRLFWHNLPDGPGDTVPPTLAFGLWQILVAPQFAVWECVVLAVILTMEAQAVFIVGHELIHRRSTWERRVANSCSPPLHTPTMQPTCLHTPCQVGTPYDMGSAPKERASGNTSPRKLRAIWQIPGR